MSRKKKPKLILVSAVWCPYHNKFHTREELEAVHGKTGEGKKMYTRWFCKETLLWRSEAVEVAYLERDDN